MNHIFTHHNLAKVGTSIALSALIFCNQGVPALAATPQLSSSRYMKAYTISSSNIPAYASESTAQRIGSVYTTDELYIYSIDDNWVYCSYPTTGTNRKKGYIKLSSVTSDNLKNTTTTARARITTYKRASQSASYGFISKGDSVTALAQKGSFTQVIYPVGSLYKAAWIKTSDYNAYIASSSTSSSSSGALSTSSSAAHSSNNVSTTVSKPVYTAPIQDTSAYFRPKSSDSGWYGYHDINGVAKGTPVYAIADGTVTYQQRYRTYNGVKYLTSYGNLIHFTSTDGNTKAFYAHLNDFEGVTVQIPSSRSKQISGATGTITLATKKVKKGQIIGYIGQTGNATGVHMHFELYVKNTRVDPVSYTGMSGK
jgi:murein DD-endopeptidase MepM/ murein hydrolase activator NlpD